MAVNEVVVVESQEQTVVVNNTTAAPVIVVENPTGVRTVDVLAGIRGVPGPVNVLTPGTITTGAPGTNVSATITGQSPNQILNLTIPRGDVGASNVLSVGTVTTLYSGQTPAVSITGTSPTQTLNLSLPKGAEILNGTGAPAGALGSINDWYLNTTDWNMYKKTGATTWTLQLNLRGATGPANTLAIGTVTGLSPASVPTASITGTSPNQTLSLGIPEGSEILNGTSNPASGTGKQGDWFINTTTYDMFEKTATSTWTLRVNIKGLKGDTGDTGATGPANQLSVGTVSTGAPGSTASVNITGTAPVQTISFAIPRGDVGPTGPAPNLAIGTTTTGAAGSNAAATVTGTNPNYAINLTIPRGDKGEIGAQWYSGAAAPTSGQYTTGDYYLVTGATGTGDVYKKTNSTTWTLQGNIRGLPGAGNVDSVNSVLPDVNGNVIVGWSDISGLIPENKLPPQAISDTFTVASEAAMLALTAQRGDYAIRTDLGATYVLTAEPASTLANWTYFRVNASNITTGTLPDGVMPDRLAPVLKPDVANIIDANSATSSGNYYLASGASILNSPDNSISYYLSVVAYQSTGSTPNYIVQRATGISTVSQSNSALWQRSMQNGVWGSWYKLQSTQTEQDARYVQLTGNQNISGTKTFTTAPIAANLSVINPTGNSSIEMGRVDGTANSPFIDFHSGATAVDYDARIAVTGGTGAVAGANMIVYANDVLFTNSVTSSFTPTATGHLTNKAYVDAQVGTRALTTHNHDASAINAGTLAIARIPTGTTSTTVALGNHLHAGVYEPVIAAGTTAQFRRGDNTWQNISGAMVDLSSAQTIAGIKTLDGVPLLWNTNVVGSGPTFNTRSTGTKIVYYPNIGASNVDYAVGIENDHMWHSVAQGTATFGFKWYGGITNIATLTGNGNFNVSGVITGNGSGLTALNGSNISTGTINTARLGSGTANSNSILRGDNTWVAADKTYTQYSGTGLTPGWVRIASQANGKAVATFTVYDDTANSHNYATFSASVSFNSDPQITLLNSGSYSSLSIKGIRIVRDNVTAGPVYANPVYLEVEIENTISQLSVQVSNSHGNGQWVPQSPANVAIGANYTLVTMLAINGNSSFSTTSELKTQGRLRAGFNNGVGLYSALTTSAAEFELSSNSMISIGEQTSGNAHPQITFYRTASGSRSGRAYRQLLDGSTGPFRWQATSGDVAYGTDSFTNLMSLDVSGNLGAVGTMTAGGAGFYGSGANITGINGSNISTGTVADARLSNNVFLLNTAQTVTGATTFNTTVTIGTNNTLVNRLTSHSETLGSAVGNYVTTRQHSHSGGTNVYKLTDILVRRNAGSDWTQTDWMQGIAVDSSYGDPATMRSWIRRDAQNQIIKLGSGTATYVEFNTSQAIFNESIQVNGGAARGRIDSSSLDWANAGLATENNTGHPSLAFHRPGVLAYQLRLNKDTSTFEFVDQIGTSYVSLAAHSATLSGNAIINGGTVTLGNATSNVINFGQSGVNSPTFTTRSAGTKIVLYSNIGAASADFALGIEGSTLWSSVGTTSQQFKWYGGTSTAATLTGTGTFSSTAVQSTATTNSLNLQRFEFTVASAARPTGSKYVEWVGPVEPTNAINGDTWVNTA